MASLSLNTGEVCRAALMIMGLNRDAANMDASTEADLRAVIRAGLRRANFPSVNGFTYQWRFREKHAPISIVTKYTTGTITVAAGTVTLAAGTWPSWVEDGFIRVDGHVLFVTGQGVADPDVIGDETLTLTVSNTQLAVAAGTEYELLRYRYPLPTDFAEWLGGVVYANGSTNKLLANTDESEIRLRYAIGQGTNTETTHYAITSTPDADALRIMFWPVPAPDAHVAGTYMSVPDDNLPADLTVPGVIVQVSPIYAEVFMEAILAAAEAYAEDGAGIHEQRFQSALSSAIAHDRCVGGAYDFSAPIRDHRGIGMVLPIDFSTQL